MRFWISSCFRPLFGFTMSNEPPFLPPEPKSADIIADVLAEKLKDKALSFALNQEAEAVDGNKDAWANVVKSLKSRFE